jgi:membrane-associated protein
VPIVRTFAPVVAGAAKMDRKKFMFFNIIGATAWGVGVTMLGYWLGSKIPNIDKYLLPMVLVATVFTFGPALWHVLKDPVTRGKVWILIKQRVKKLGRLIGLNKEIDL